jgi:hypothetical protein
MTKLFNKLLFVSATALSILCSFACSDKIAGTAEEPNQFAFGVESSSSISSSEQSDNTMPSSASSPLPQTPASSSSERIAGSVDVEPESSSSDHNDPTGLGGNDCYSKEGQTNLCGTVGQALPSLNDYLKKYGITGVSYDEHVLAYNKTFDSSKETTESENIAELRTVGLHKFTRDNLKGTVYLFPGTMLQHSNLYSKEDEVYIGEDGCPLYVLNIIDTSPAIHVLTSITKDTITIADIHDNCDYECRPFDMHVGFLIAYCGEISESPKIVRTFTLNESMSCGDVEYGEYVKK